MTTSETPTAGCYACGLTSGAEELFGGQIDQTDHWVVEHCMGPLGTGTLIVKPLRHVLSVGDLTVAEASELGPLLQRVSAAVQDLSEADQVYACLWSHAAWEPGHIHFVVQPAWGHQRERYPLPGPALQTAMFQEGAALDRDEVAAFCERARERLR